MVADLLKKNLDDSIDGATLQMCTFSGDLSRPFDMRTTVKELAEFMPTTKFQATTGLVKLHPVGSSPSLQLGVGVPWAPTGLHMTGKPGNWREVAPIIILAVGAGGFANQ